MRAMRGIVWFVLSVVALLVLFGWWLGYIKAPGIEGTFYVPIGLLALVLARAIWSSMAGNVVEGSLVFGILSALINAWILVDDSIDVEPIVGIGAWLVSLIPAIFGLILGVVALRRATERREARTLPFLGIVLNLSPIASIVLASLCEFC